MQELIKIQNAKGIKAVSARELYDFLEVKKDFTNWCKAMFNYGYEGLGLHYKKHEVVNHSINEFKNKNNYHTNNVESAWSVLKRTIRGTHIHVSQKHLQKYVDEVAFRMMNKDKQDVMFETILSHVV